MVEEEEEDPPPYASLIAISDDAKLSLEGGLSFFVFCPVEETNVSLQTFAFSNTQQQQQQQQQQQRAHKKHTTRFSAYYCFRLSNKNGE